MLELLDTPDHVVAFSLAGTLTGEDYDRIVAEVEGKLSRHQRIGVLVDLVSFEDLTLEAGAKDVAYSLKSLWRLNRFPREAVITDKEWVRTLARLADRLVPGVEVRAFSPPERDAALAWVGDL